MAAAWHGGRAEIEAMVAARAKALEDEMVLARALDEFDVRNRLRQIEALKLQRFSMFT